MVGRKSQTVLEYAVLFSVVIAALLIMQVFIKRAYQGRLKQEADSVGQQYEMGKTTAETITETRTIRETYSGGQTSASGVFGKSVDVPTGTTVTKSRSTTSFQKAEEVGGEN